MHTTSFAMRKKHTLLRAAASSLLVKMSEVPLSSRAPVEDRLPIVFPPTFTLLNFSAQYLHTHPFACITNCYLCRLAAK